MPTSSAAEYAVTETLRDRSVVTIRAQRPGDRDALLAAFHRTSRDSLFRRFFTPKRSLSEQEIAHFMNADFDRHVALVAETTGSAGVTEIVGGGRYFKASANEAELAFVGIDAFQGKGLGTLLLRHLILLARKAGLKQLTADVLPENTVMRAVFKKAGFAPAPGHDPGVAHLALPLTPAD
jgi:RimJ/RimL family protein N-acetyltransferase